MPSRKEITREATRRADDRFFAENPALYRRDGRRQNRNWLIRTNRAYRTEWYNYFREAKQELTNPTVVNQADDQNRTVVARAPDNNQAVVNQADHEDPVNAVTDCPNERVASLCTPISGVKLTSVRYLNKFTLYNEEEKWTYRPALPYHPVDWTPEMEKPNPVVVYFDDPQALAVQITYRVEDEDACVEYGVVQPLIRKANGTFLSHNYVDNLEFSPGRDHPVDFVAVERPPAQIATMNDWGREWQARLPRRDFDMGTPSNTIYLTWGKPKEGRYIEDGPTLKRMDASVGLAFGANSIDEFKVITHIFSLFDSYTLGLDHLDDTRRKELEDDKELMKSLTDANWPTYFHEEQTEKTGAWSILEHPRYAAECQAICRMIRGVVRQLGGKSKLGLRTYTADFSNPTVVLNRGEPTGPREDREYALADRPVEVGKCYSENDVGFNNFEAYLKVKSPGMERSRLFGGGVGLIPEDKHPLACFYALVEFKWVRRLVRKEKDGPKVWEWQRMITDMYDYKKEDAFKGWDGKLP
ncbi:MAG: hypothetical protein AAGH68_09580 [Pseudomonadota bacterium]